ncbi:hypothetical protein N9J16_00675 [Candidatus Poseidoniaceae archaeon]|nr:hypothetical protein [Candidatus Poseidoniaceae archaeon]
MEILTQMENAAVKGESSIEIEWHSFIQDLDLTEVPKSLQNPKGARQFSNLILCVVDSGGSGISVTKDVYQFFRALIQRFMPEIFARPMSPMDAPPAPPGLRPMPSMPPMPEEMPPISSGIEVNVIGHQLGYYSMKIPLQLKVFENQSIPDIPKVQGSPIAPKLIRISW